MREAASQQLQQSYDTRAEQLPLPALPLPPPSRPGRSRRTTAAAHPNYSLPDDPSDGSDEEAGDDDHDTDASLPHRQHGAGSSHPRRGQSRAAAATARRPQRSAAVAGQAALAAAAAAAAEEENAGSSSSEPCTSPAGGQRRTGVYDDSAATTGGVATWGSSQRRRGGRPPGRTQALQTGRGSPPSGCLTEGLSDEVSHGGNDDDEEEEEEEEQSDQWRPLSESRRHSLGSHAAPRITATIQMNGQYTQPQAGRLAPRLPQSATASGSHIRVKLRSGA